MKQWRCKICGYEHQGDVPPAACPLCGVGPEEFELIGLSAGEISSPGKRWKCTVCDYLHHGEEPPKTCPLCGVGPERFVLLAAATAALDAASVRTADAASARAAAAQLSYGLYVITACREGSINGQCANTVVQVTDTPLCIALGINKNNLTHEYMMASGHVVVSLLGREHFDMVRRFGYQSGRKVDKFAALEYVRAQNGCPIPQGCIAYLEAVLLPDKMVDVGTHTLFVAQVTAGRVLSDEAPLTYAEYRNLNKK